MLEALQHAQNCFVTLTYENEPEDGNLVPGDLRNWLKRLRLRCLPARIRYFAVGEYGPGSMRPHYHAAIFGLETCTGGVVVVRNGRRLCQCRTCSIVRETWSLGFVSVGRLETQSAQYIAGYVTKKLADRKDARMVGRVPEFARMSLKPGIGASAMPDVASVMMQYKLEEKLGDAVIGLRHGAQVLPLGRYLRKLLRCQVGLPEGAPEHVLEALRQGLLPVYDATEFVVRAPGMARFRRALVGQVVEEVYKQAAANAAAKSIIYTKRTL